MPTLSDLFGCSPPIDCPGSDNPVLNLSAEAPDNAIAIGLNWGPPYIPPANNGYVSQGCLGECDSEISQEDADLCAARQALLCVNDKHNNPNPLPGPSVVCNTTQTATVFCPDGLPFNYTVPAGLFCGTSITICNQQALAYATKLARQLKICLDDPQQCTCINQPYSSQVSIAGATSSGVTWSITQGQLPTGLSLDQTGAISGTPNTAGTFNFTVLAVTSLGTFMQKPLKIVVLQITTATLPTFFPGLPYSAQLSVTGGSGNYAWRIVAGSLPDGLNLSQAGLISGTPTGNNTGSGSIQFGVIDTSCEPADQSAIPPVVSLVTKSTTTIGQLLGFSEYGGFVSTPPKKYRRITWQGSSEQTLFNGPNQIAGAKYVYSGSTEIDFFGNILSTYTKNLSEMCTAADKTCQGIGFQSVAPLAPAVAAFNILGWMGFPGAQSCSGTGIPYTGVGDVGLKGAGEGAKFDSGFSSGFTFGPGEVFEFPNGTFAATSATAAGDTGAGSQSIRVFTTPQVCGTLVPQGPILDTTSTLALVEWNNNYSATLDEEYTEFDALTSGDTFSGAGATAAYFRNGFTVTQTSIAWTLNFSNLVVGQGYVASYRLTNPSTGSIQTVQVGFKATAKTFSISGAIGAPPSGQSITISNPSVTFAT